MFGIVSRRSGQRNPHAARMQEVSMRSFASAIDEPMLFQLGDELPNLTRHTDNITQSENFKATRNVFESLQSFKSKGDDRHTEDGAYVSRTNTPRRSLLAFAAGLHDSASIPKEFAGQPSTLSYQPSAISYSSAEANAKADQLTTLPSLNHPASGGLRADHIWLACCVARQAGRGF